MEILSVLDLAVLTFMVEKPPSIMQTQVWIVVFPGFLLLDATGPVQVFSSSNDECRGTGKPIPYTITLVSVDGGAVTSCSGVAVLTSPLPSPDTLRGATLVVAGGAGIAQMLEHRALISWIAEAASVVKRCASVCTGAFLLAEAGVLAHKRAVTHWQDADNFRRRYPNVGVHNDALYMKDGAIYSSAGITAGIDLCVSLVEEDLGRPVALGVAKRLVMYHKRPGGQRQFSSELLADSSGSDLAGQLVQWLKPRVAQEIDVDRMAEALALSPRSLHRRLRQEADLSPAQLLTRVRMEVACSLLESSSCSVKQVARDAGFSSEYNLRRAFSQHLGVLPSEYRERFG